MKKIFVLFLSIALLTACNNNDDSNPENDPILGKWFIVEINNSPIPGFSLNECNTKSNMTFNSDGITNSVFHSEIDGNCTAGPSENGEWRHQSGIYTFTLPIPELEPFSPISGRIQFNANSFTFTPISSPGTTIVFNKG